MARSPLGQVDIVLIDRTTVVEDCTHNAHAYAGWNSMIAKFADRCGVSDGAGGC
jgi:hypothetical protein